MIIRKAREKDLKRVSEFLRLEFSEKPYNEKWTEESSLIKIKECYELYDIYVAVLNKRIVGAIISSLEFWYVGNNGWIEYLVVGRAFQGKGIGKLLIKKIEEDYRGRGAVSIYLMAFKKSPAYKFYKRIGYKNRRKLAVFQKRLR